jgi:predicted permease
MSARYDVRVSFRQIRQRPLFTLAAVLTLAIGIGVNTVAFTVVNGLLFKGSAASAAPGVGRILTTPGGDESGNASLAEYERFADATRDAFDIAAEGRGTVAWRRDGTTRNAWALFVTPNYFSMVDVRPIAGQLHVGRTSDVVPSVVIGERFWRNSLGASPLSGLTLRLNDITVAVAGVLPDSYTGPAGLYSPDVWLPLDDIALFNPSPTLLKRDERWLFVLGRVRPQVSTAEIRARIDAAAAAMARDWPDSHRERGARLRLISEGNNEFRALGTAAAIGMSIIGLVLLLACFNVANLLVARGVEREREMAIRAAIGAGRLRLVRMVVIDGLVLAAIAGAASLVLARWTQTFVGSFAIPVDVPQHIDLTPDLRVVGFASLLALIAGVLPGLWPAVAALRVNVARALGASGGNSAGRSTSRARGWLVTAQIAGSTAFLAVAGLLLQSYGHLSAIDLGFARDHLLVAEVRPTAYGHDADGAARYVRALADRARAVPGARQVAVATHAPFFIGFTAMTAIAPAESACPANECSRYPVRAVDASYFSTMGIGLVAGREFAATGAAEVIVNQSLARALWPDGRGLGQPVRLGDRGTPATVVAVTAKTLTGALDREQPTLYVPLAPEHFEGELSIIVRSAVPPESLIKPIGEAADLLDPRVALLSVKTINQRAAVQLWPFKTASALFSICGALALILATVGLGAAVIHSVNRRLKEFAVRVSLGASPRDLLVDVGAGAARFLVPGLVIGIVLAAGVGRLVQFALVGVDALNPSTYVVVAAVESLVVVIACAWPAVRAMRVDPLVTLRAE